MLSAKVLTSTALTYTFNKEAVHQFVGGLIYKIAGTNHLNTIQTCFKDVEYVGQEMSEAFSSYKADE
jgi:hypothetical protein